jgi:hypothetical protein
MPPSVLPKRVYATEPRETGVQLFGGLQKSADRPALRIRAFVQVLRLFSLDNSKSVCSRPRAAKEVRHVAVS